MRYVLLITLMWCGVAQAQELGTWQKKADFPGGGRRSAFCFVIGDKGYVGGGQNPTGKFQSDFWEYNAATDQWTQKADFGGGPRFKAVGFSLNGKGYVGLGIDNNIDLRKDIWEYDPTFDTWIQRSNFGGLSRYSAVSFAVGNNIFVGMGDSLEPIGDYWKYDSLTDSWTQNLTFPGYGRHGTITFTIGGKGYVGSGLKNFSSGFLDDFWEYDSTNTWTQRADIPDLGRHHAVGFAIGNKGYLSTGIGFGFLNDLWEYDPVTNAWTQKASIPDSARNEAVGLAIGNKGYVGLGFRNGIDVWDLQGAGFFTDWWEYTPDSATSTLSIQSNAFDVTIHPNPSLGDAVLKCSTNTAALNVEITDVAGKNLLSISGHQGTSLTLPSQELSPGIYLIRVTNGSTTASLKLVKL